MALNVRLIRSSWRNMKIKHLIRKIACKIKGHHWQPAELSYYAYESEKWEYITEEARWCKRCGRFVVPNSKLFQRGTSGDTWIKEVLK